MFWKLFGIASFVVAVLDTRRWKSFVDAVAAAAAADVDAAAADVDAAVAASDAAAAAAVDAADSDAFAWTSSKTGKKENNSKNKK